MKTFKSSTGLFLQTDHPSWNIYAHCAFLWVWAFFLNFNLWNKFWLQQQSVQHFFFSKSTSTEDDNWSRFSSGAVHNVIIKPEFNCDTELMMSRLGSWRDGGCWNKTMEDFVIIFRLKFLTFCVARKHLKTMDPQCLPLNGTALITASSQRKGGEQWEAATDC